MRDGRDHEINAIKLLFLCQDVQSNKANIIYVSGNVA